MLVLLLVLWLDLVWALVLVLSKLVICLGVAVENIIMFAPWGKVYFRVSNTLVLQPRVLTRLSCVAAGPLHSTVRSSAVSGVFDGKKNKTPAAPAELQFDDNTDETKVASYSPSNSVPRKGILKVDHRKKAMQDAIDWLRKNAPNLDNVDLVTAAAVTKLTGTCMPKTARVKKKDKKKYECAKALLGVCS